MNQIKIGKFIAEERKNKKLTQSDLANILGVTDRSVSKWENGKCLPDISLFEPICNEFNISISEFLAGERTKEEKKDDKEVINYIKQTKKKSTHKFIILGIVSILLITFILSTVVYFFNNYNKIKVYKLYGETDNFAYVEMYLIESNSMYMLTTGNFQIKNTSEISESDVLLATIKSEDRTIFGSVVGKSITHTEKKGYNEVFDEVKMKNIDNWYIEVVYKNNGEQKFEKIYLKNEILMKSDEFISKKVEEIGSHHDYNEEYIDADYQFQVSEITRRGNILINEGYTEDWKDELYGDIAVYTKKFDKEYIKLWLDLSSPELTYQYQINKNTIIGYNGRLSYKKYKKIEDGLDLYIRIDEENYEFKYYLDENKIESEDELPKNIDIYKYSKDAALKIKEIYDLLYV